MNDREKFEAWAKKNYFYVDVKENSWQVWQAATARDKENMNDREKFEKHAKEVLKLCVDIGVDGEYESDRTRENWLTWQAATAESATQTIEQDLVYEAWRNSEAYQVPMTELGQKIAEQRYYGFQKGWEYAKFYEKHKHVDMKSFLENYY